MLGNPQRSKICGASLLRMFVAFGVSNLFRRKTWRSDVTWTEPIFLRSSVASGTYRWGTSERLPPRFRLSRGNCSCQKSSPHQLSCHSDISVRSRAHTKVAAVLNNTFSTPVEQLAASANCHSTCSASTAHVTGKTT